MPPIRPEDVRPLTDFLRNHREAVARLGSSGRPEVLTVHGKAALVVQDARAYRSVLELAEQMATVLAVREGHDSIERGEGMTLGEFERRFRERFPLPGEPGATGTEGR